MENSTEVAALHFTSVFITFLVQSFANLNPASMRPVRSPHPDCVRIEVMHHSHSWNDSCQHIAHDGHSLLRLFKVLNASFVTLLLLLLCTMGHLLLVGGGPFCFPGAVPESEFSRSFHCRCHCFCRSIMTNPTCPFYMEEPKLL